MTLTALTGITNEPYGIETKSRIRLEGSLVEEKSLQEHEFGFAFYGPKELTEKEIIQALSFSKELDKENIRNTDLLTNDFSDSDNAYIKKSIDLII